MRVLDAGALIALDRGDRDTWSLLAETQLAGQRPVVPAPVIAQAWRGAALQARLATVLSGADVVVADGPLSRRAGELLATAATAGPMSWTPW
ncbi:MAG: PIN domain-containing protein [Acidimicrobiales bacterium]